MHFLVAFDVSHSYISNHQSFESLTVESINVMGYVLTANAPLNQPVEAPDPHTRHAFSPTRMKARHTPLCIPLRCQRVIVGYETQSKST